MIKLFKKGAYKISAAALLCCVLVGAITLTNATSYKEIALAQSGGNIEAFNTDVAYKENMPGKTQKFLEYLDNWLCNQVIPLTEGLVCTEPCE